MKKVSLFLSIVLLIGILAACGAGKDDKAKDNSLNESKLLVGVTGGPHEQIMEQVKLVAEKDGLEIEIKSFSDYVIPNTSLSEGDLDVNSYQHKPFLDKFNADHSTNLVPVAKTILNPMAVYSNEYKDMKDLPDGSKFGLPNDPTNGSRALFILQEAGIIKLDEAKKETANIHDVIENPQNLEFIELDAAQIPNQLGELAAAAINTNFAIATGLNPKKDSILLESTDSPYVNYIVVRAENENDEVLKKLIKAYQSPEVKKFVEEEFGGSIIPGW